MVKFWPDDHLPKKENAMKKDIVDNNKLFCRDKTG